MRRRLAVSGLLAVLFLLAFSARADALPDGRVYELVTPPDMNGVSGSVTFNAPDGNTVDWPALGGCCGATTGGVEFFQSRRGDDGWSTRGLTPTPSRSLEGFLEQQAPVFWSRDLSTTIFNTPETYDPADAHPGTLNLYSVGPFAQPIWLSQGPLGGTASPFDVTFDGANPDASMVIFSTRAQLTEDATGLSDEINTKPEYLYARDVVNGTTRLVNVNNSGTVVDPYGATLGNGNFLGQGVVAPNYLGTTTNAVSSDGTKVFFQSPPSGLNVNGPEPQAHLFMRDLATETTTALDDPTSSGFARYEGASEDGSLVFFASNEGLAGGSNDLELYEFNTTTHAIGPAPAGSAIPLSAGDSGTLDGHLLGASAIANDGSHVYFVAEAVLTSKANGIGATAQSDEPNFYVFDTKTGETGFIATLGPSDVFREAGLPGPLTQEPDVTRPAVPTPDGGVLVFESKADLTGQNPEGPTTALTSEIFEQTNTITVESTAGFVVGREVEIGENFFPEKAEIKSIPSATEIVLATPVIPSWGLGTSVTQLSVSEVYRYVAADGALDCVSCAEAGVPVTGPSLLTGMGGSYAPANQDATMSADGSRIFFMSQMDLVPEAESPSAMNIYEWENGGLALISDGHSTQHAFLFGTTPSGDDVFFATRDQLLPEATPGYLHTYDARVGGGFPESEPAPEPCSGVGCRSPQPAPGPSGVPGSATVGGGSEPKPTDGRSAFRVAKITATQLKRFARGGKVTLTITVPSPGRIVLHALAKLRTDLQVVAAAKARFTGREHRKRVTLHLGRAARARLAESGELPLRIELLDTAGREVQVLRLTLSARTRTSNRPGLPGR